jgi:hypothetical protein
MSHDKIKAAARERMARTGEPYATARREVIAEIRAAAAAHEELGPEYSDAVVASFLERVEEEIDARVNARMAEVRGPDAPARTGQDSRRVLLRGIAIGVMIGLFAAVMVGGSPDERLHRRVLLLAAVLVAIAVTYAVSRARPGISQAREALRRPAAPSARADRTTR